jgi:hypothetical protein
VFPAFAKYRDLAAESGREIPMIELNERPSTESATPSAASSDLTSGEARKAEGQ